MSLIEKIKSDKELEGLFLNYMSLHLQKRDLPDELPDQKDEQKVTEYLKITYDFNKAVEKLINNLKKKYKLPDDIGHENSKINEVLIEVGEHYLSKYGADYIKKYRSG